MIHTEVGRKFALKLVFSLKKETRPLYQTGVYDLCGGPRRVQLKSGSSDVERA